MSMTLFETLVLSKNPLGFYKFDEDLIGSTLSDSSPRGNHLYGSVTSSELVTGKGSWTPYARKSASGVSTPIVLENLSTLTYEASIKLDSVDRYVFAEVSSTSGLELLFEVSQHPTFLTQNVIKVGFGFGTWDINTSSTHQHAFVYSIDVTNTIFDGNWHNLVIVWDGTSASSWAGSQFKIYVDGVDITNTGSASQYSTSYGAVPLTYSIPITIAGPQQGPVTTPATFDNIALYDVALTENEVIAHNNASSIIESAVELDESIDLPVFTDGVLSTAYETDTAQALRVALPDIIIEATSSVEVKASNEDDFSLRTILDDEGFTTVPLNGATVESGEPGGTSGVLGTRWYEVPFTATRFEQARVDLSSSESNVRFRVFIQSNYNDIEDSDDLSEDDYLDSEYDSSDPTFSTLTQVVSETTSSVFILDPNYSGPYFIQVSLLSGTGTDIEMEWGSADALIGGIFSDPINLGTSSAGRNVAGSTSNAYIEAGEPAGSSGINSTRSVWYQWTAPATVAAMSWNFSVSGSRSFEVEMYMGDAIGALTQVASEYSIGGAPTVVEWTPVAGTTYRIRVGSDRDYLSIDINWSIIAVEVPAMEPVKSLRVTVHAGVVGGHYGGRSYSPNELITELPNRIGSQFQEALNVPGSGSITVLQNDPVLRAYAPPGWEVQGQGANNTGTVLLATTNGPLVANATTIHTVAALPNSINPDTNLHIIASNGSSEYVKVKQILSTTSFTITHKLRYEYPSGSQIFSNPKSTDDPFQLLRVGNFVKFWMDTTDSTGTAISKCVSGFIIKNRDIPIVGSGEDADRTITVSGPTLHQLFADIVVMHDRSGFEPVNEDRYFSWNSSVTSEDMTENGGWFDKTGTYSTHAHAWNHPIKTNTQKNPPGWRKKKNEPAKKRPKYALNRLGKKKRFPDKNAKWMWMDKEAGLALTPKFKTDLYTSHYYRAKKLNVTKKSKYRITVNSDTAYEVYLDGRLIMSGNGLEKYTKFKSSEITLYPTSKDIPNSLTIHVGDQYNVYKKKKKKSKKKKLKATKVDFDHNDAFMISIQKLNAKNKIVGSPLINSTGTTKWFAYHGETPPGWNRAQVLMTLLREGAERNNDSAKLLYNATDSNLGVYSSDAPDAVWWDLKEFNSSIKVGTSLLDVQAQMSEIRKFDVWVDPDTCEVFAWQGGNNGSYPRGRDVSKNVALVPGQNLIAYAVSEIDQMVNFLVIQYAKGFTTAEPDAESPQGEIAASYGTREAYLELGGLHDPESAITLGESLLSSLVDTTNIANAGDIVGHINETYAGSIVPIRGATPFIDFNVGDTVMSPSYNGLAHPHRILSLSCSEDSEGQLTFEPELEGV